MNKRNTNTSLCELLRRVTGGFLTLLCLTSCAVGQNPSSQDSMSVSSKSENGSDTDQIDDNQPTSEDYDAMRMEIIQDRGEVNKEEIIQGFPYVSDKLGAAFLSSDPMTTVLENYLYRTIFLEEGVINHSISLLYYDAATHNLTTAISKKHLPEKYAGYDVPSVFYMKEDIDMVAKLLFGEETIIDYAVVEESPGQYLYDGLSKTASFERLAKDGDKVVVLSCIDQGDFYEVIVVFLYCDVYHPNEFGARLDGEVVFLSKEESIDYCINTLYSSC